MSGYAVVTIAAVALQTEAGINCKCFIDRGGALLQSRTGSTQIAADCVTTVTQLGPVTRVGTVFRILAQSLPASTFNDIVEAINTALEGSGSFTVTIQNAVQTETLTCIPDFDQDWAVYEANQRYDERVIKGPAFALKVVEAA